MVGSSFTVNVIRLLFAVLLLPVLHPAVT